MQFKRINNITGWLVCLIACSVYILTAEKAGSLWDCGEFVSSAYKLQIPHPPGAPMFVLLGRFFIILFGDNPMTVAKAVNIMNALASGFTILFLFWTITHFARKLVLGWDSKDENLTSITSTQMISVMGAGIVGALAYTFSDSFWYSAVEGEVYALSSFFTAIVFWAILKWEHVAHERGADKWIVFIFFMMGLSIGVHLLNLLTIPAIVMVYYFKKRDQFNYATMRKYFMWVVGIGIVLAMIVTKWASGAEAEALAPLNGSTYISQILEPHFGKEISLSDNTLTGFTLLAGLLVIGFLYLVEAINPKRKEFYGGAFIFFLIGCAITGFVQKVVIQYSINGAGLFDRKFVNDFGTGFFVGFAVFFVLLAVLIWFGLRYASQKRWQFLRLGLWCIVFMLIGYSTYITTMIRSSADPSVDMYNVDNPMSLTGYLGREQYGDFPLLYGQTFTASPVTSMETGTKYKKVVDSTGKGKYEEVGKDFKPVYLPVNKMLFPRMWDASNDQNHAYYYALMMDMNPQQNQYGLYEREPTQADNIKYFVSYQTYYMYLRYFLWNFAGKQNDVQGIFAANVRDGNWISGINWMDKSLYGDQSLMPDSLKHNKANNKLFMLPLILGIIGMVYHYKRKGNDFFINLLMFFFTGMAIVLYLNQPGFQPRERDYAYVGSFYAFAVWIGLAVPALVEAAVKKAKDLNASQLITGGVIAALFLIAGVVNGGGANFGIGFFAIYALVALGIPFILSLLKDSKIISYAAVLITLLAAPVLMGWQEWDDHDRSKKVIAGDLARDYLENCAPNAIVFSFGDNDTYPLWYAQEVEGVRPDVRVINYSLLGIDWYVNQLRYKVNESAPIDVIWSKDQLADGKLDYITFQAKAPFNDSTYSDLYTLMKDYVGNPKMSPLKNERYTFPTHKVSVPVNIDSVRNNGTVEATDANVLSQLLLTIPKDAMGLNDLTVLNIIAANAKNGWTRPIYFTGFLGGNEGIGIDPYLRREGLVYRLVPVMNEQINTNKTFDFIMNTDTTNGKPAFRYGSSDIPGVYFDEENRRHLMTMREAHQSLAIDLVQKGRKEDARKVLNKVDKTMLESNMPYGLASRGNRHNESSLQFMQIAYMADDKALGDKVKAAVKKDLEQQMRFFNALDEKMKERMGPEMSRVQQALQSITDVEKQQESQVKSPEAAAPNAKVDSQNRELPNQ